MRSAFRNLGVSRKCGKFLVMMARSPLDGNTYFFVDKCLAFGAAFSCAVFQAFSNSIAHLVKFRTGKDLLNYLDDYFFVHLLKMICNGQIEVFLHICELINFPVSLDKTIWATTSLTFLGYLIDMVQQLVMVPVRKIMRGQELIEGVLSKKKMTLQQLQKICGFLNFLGRCMIPGRAFTRRLYAHTAGLLKPHYHLRITSEMHRDLLMWQEFLRHPSVFARPFMDFSLNPSSRRNQHVLGCSKKLLFRFWRNCRSIMDAWYLG